jgi:hypothetical protein
MWRHPWFIAVGVAAFGACGGRTLDSQNEVAPDQNTSDAGFLSTGGASSTGTGGTDGLKDAGGLTVGGSGSIGNKDGAGPAPVDSEVCPVGDYFVEVTIDGEPLRLELNSPESTPLLDQAGAEVLTAEVYTCCGDTMLSFNACSSRADDATCLQVVRGKVTFAGADREALSGSAPADFGAVVESWPHVTGNLEVILTSARSKKKKVLANVSYSLCGYGVGYCTIAC